LPEPISIAPAQVGDCSDCASLLVEQLREHGVEESAERLVRVMESVVGDPARGFLMHARDCGKAVGIAYAAVILSAEHCGPVAWLEELYVAPGHRARGIGTALLRAVVDHCRRGGIVAVDLEIDARHNRVESLYQRFGFQRLDRSRWVSKLIQ
jgi:AhpD family alkylhydroperoxidase